MVLNPCTLEKGISLQYEFAKNSCVFLPQEYGWNICETNFFFWTFDSLMKKLADFSEDALGLRMKISYFNTPEDLTHSLFWFI